jgi:U2 small nuclear ribonucleoprotein B''
VPWRAGRGSSRETTPNHLLARVSAELKKCLHACFAQFGRILDVVVMSRVRCRGQAWVVFADVPSATAAIRGLQSFPFFGKPLRLTYALTKSDAAAKAEGTWKPRPKGAKAASAGGRPKRAAAAATPAPAPAADANPPHKTLFVQNLPPATTEAMLAMLFQQFPGFDRVRLVAAKPGVAFVDFDAPASAGVARAGLAGFKVTPEHAMAVAFAKQ